jgi:hypothetical protein
MKTINKFRNHLVMNTIKKIMLLLFVIATTLSCSKDDSTLAEEPETILSNDYANMVGVWYLKETIKGDGTTMPHFHKCSTQKDFWNFKANFDIEKSIFALHCYDEGVDTQATYNAVTKDITFGSPYFQRYTITKISNKELVLSYIKDEGTVVEERKKEIFTRK